MSKFFICEYCVADNELRRELQERGTARRKKCLVCRKSGGRALPTSDARVKRTFRALVRLNFSEWDYNHHIGGDSLQSLVLESKSIFDLGPSTSPMDFEDAYLVLEDSWYPSTDEEIALGGGYWEGGILDGLRRSRDVKVENLIRDALVKNCFEIDPVARALVDNLRADLTQIIPAGTCFYRGRVGVQARMTPVFSEPQYGDVFWYLPYTGKEIDRPPLNLATEGRFNRPRVSIYYLASDSRTAIAELRPHPGHLVSSAQFRLKRDLLVANFASHDIREFLSDQRLEDLRTILSIADVLNVPVQPEHRVLYAVTQLFSDAVRAEGFEGLTFGSSVGTGTNLTCFAGDAFEMVAGSESVQEVLSLDYQLAEAPVLPQDYDKDKYAKDEESPLSTLLHGMARKVSER